MCAIDILRIGLSMGTIFDIGKRLEICRIPEYTKERMIEANTELQKS